MNQNAILLTSTDTAILESYKTIAEGLADYLGDGYEIVVHSLGNYEKSVIKIINGHHTGRKEGSPITDLGLKMVSSINHSTGAKYLSYFNKNAKGEPLKSCSIAINGENGRLIGLLCINFYINTPLSNLIASLLPGNPETGDATLTESFAENASDLIQLSLKEARETVYNDRSISAANKNKEIIAILYEKGIFNLKDSVISIAEKMGISKNTVYMHIRNLSRK